MRTEREIEAAAWAIDPDAWHPYLKEDGLGVYWHTRRNVALSRAKAALAAADAEAWRPIEENIPRDVVVQVRRPLNGGDVAYELWAVAVDGTVERAGMVPTPGGLFAFAHNPGRNRLADLVASGATWRHIPEPPK